MAAPMFAVDYCRMAKTAPKSVYRFKELRDISKITLEELSGDVDISVSQLSRFESGDREPRVDELLRVAARLRVPWQEFVETSSTGWMAVPLVSAVSAGRLIEHPRLDALDEEFQHVYAAGLPSGDWVAMRVEGSSMDRISPPESIIFVDRRDKRLVPNACYVIDDPEEGATYKRFRPDPMRFEPVTFSDGHRTLFPENEPRVLGRVKRTVLDL
jgi:transcriptional regulator with XRE-family HTH domain